MPDLEPEQLTPEQVEEIYQKLPEDIKTALYSEINALFIRQAAAKFKLPPEKIPLLADETGIIMMGISPWKELARNLQEDLNLDAKTAYSLTQEIDFKIFSPIRQSLLAVHGLLTSPTMTPSPSAIPKPALETPAMPMTAPLTAPPFRSSKPTPAPISPQRPTSMPTMPRPAAPPPPPALPTMPTYRPTTPLPVRPPVPPVASTPIPPISAWPTPPLPGQPRPFIPPRPIPREPGMIFPRTMTPFPVPPKPFTEKPSLFPQAPTVPKPPLPTAPIAGKPVPAATILKPAVEPMIAPKPAILPFTEPIDLTKLNANDPRLEGNVVDLKNLE